MFDIRAPDVPRMPRMPWTFRITLWLYLGVMGFGLACAGIWIVLMLIAWILVL